MIINVVIDRLNWNAKGTGRLHEVYIWQKAVLSILRHMYLDMPKIVDNGHV